MKLGKVLAVIANRSSAKSFPKKFISSSTSLLPSYSGAHYVDDGTDDDSINTINHFVDITNSTLNGVPFSQLTLAVIKVYLDKLNIHPQRKQHCPHSELKPGFTLQELQAFLLHYVFVHSTESITAKLTRDADGEVTANFEYNLPPVCPICMELNHTGAQCEVTTVKGNNNDLCDDDVERMMKAILEHNKPVRTILLAGNGVGVRSARSVATLIRGSKDVAEVNLFRNQIGDDGLEAIAEALTETESLRYLNLCHNDFGERGVQAVARALGDNRSLTDLFLYDSAAPSLATIRTVEESLRRNLRLVRLELVDSCRGPSLPSGVIQSLLTSNQTLATRPSAAALAALPVARTLLSGGPSGIPQELRTRILGIHLSNAAPELCEEQVEGLVQFAESKSTLTAGTTPRAFLEAVFRREEGTGAREGRRRLRDCKSEQQFERHHMELSPRPSTSGLRVRIESDAVSLAEFGCTRTPSM